MRVRHYWWLLLTVVPLANHVMMAGGLEMADYMLRVIVSPAVVCWCPLIVTFSGATVREFELYRVTQS